MKIRRIPWPTLLIITVVVVPIAWFFYTQTEWVDSERYNPPSREANRNPLLASTQLLEHYGYTTEEIRNPRFFNQFSDAIDKTVWIHNANTIQDENTVSALVKFVESGGHLLLGVSSRRHFYSSQTMEPEDFPLLLALGIEAYVRFDKKRVTPPWEYQFEASYTDDERKALRTPYPHQHPYEDADLIIDYINRGYDIRTLPTLDNSHGVLSLKQSRLTLMDLTAPQTVMHQLKFPQKDASSLTDFINVQLRRGSGVISVLGDGTQFTNAELGEYDNGAYLMNLLAQHPSKSVHYLLQHRDSPGLIRTLWANFPVAFILFALALLLWVWQTAMRFGPIRTEVTASRANLLSHLRARGHFWRRRNELPALTEPVRLSAIETLYRMHSRTAPVGNNLIEGNTRPIDQFASEPALPQDWVEKIASELGCSVQDVKRALHPAPLSARELPVAAAVLQHIFYANQSLR